MYILRVIFWRRSRLCSTQGGLLTHKQDLTALRRPTCDLHYLTLAINKFQVLSAGGPAKARAPFLLTAPPGCEGPFHRHGPS